MEDVPNLGRVHRGFYEALPIIWPQIKRIVGATTYVMAGHSRGAGEATICTGMAVVDDWAPKFRIVFGEPLSGDQWLQMHVAEVAARSYVNGSADGKSTDLVTQVPLHIAGIFPYFRATPTMAISNDPGPNDAWPGELRFHHMQLYQEVVGNKLLTYPA